MPMICEVCGSVEDSVELSALNEHLHVCANCMMDRQHPEVSGLWDEEQ
ncbi:MULTISPECIES: hypothetical protein [unclassified Paenibacillus]|nr:MULTISPECIES: hypothetical protein [unclassified Paenibacillus]MBP1153786.1 ribosome-binding protein aMBF1 (putative translation factor) [Paenibacillus sp. PvP091]MBP1170829.1 ribosome-binding protein aMBF1 (putative translation factor) [Paenibacillus sp. PvR098]MBP2441857.1 ribosome-binding protein aMBF1 (putative translation factor) [Paenibacillus sp. PvP052]